MNGIQGIGVVKGIAKGTLLYTEDNRMLFEGQFQSVDIELKRLAMTYQSANERWSKLSKMAYDKFGLVAFSLVQGYLNMLNDSVYTSDIKSYIKQHKVSASTAVREVTKQYSKPFEESDNEYLRSRADDFKELEKQLCTLMNNTKDGKRREDQPYILLAKDMGVISLLSLSANVCGIILLHGKEQSHVTVLADCIKLPMIIQVKQKITECINRYVIMDANTGSITVKE